MNEAICGVFAFAPKHISYLYVTLRSCVVRRRNSTLDNLFNTIIIIIIMIMVSTECYGIYRLYRHTKPRWLSIYRVGFSSFPSMPPAASLFFVSQLIGFECAISVGSARSCIYVVCCNLRTASIRHRLGTSTPYVSGICVLCIWICLHFLAMCVAITFQITVKPEPSAL